MKGVILAGGTGSRLSPITDVTNKHLLPVGTKPMIIHVVEKMVEANVLDIMIITGTEHMGDMISLLGSGEKYNCEFTFRIQERAHGIADALRLAESFINNDKFIVILGDNMFEDDLSKHIKEYEDSDSPCFLLLKEVPDPERYGIAILDKDRKIIGAVEKPRVPISNLCITGIYMYDETVFKKIKNLKPSDRGEYEITELNHEYIEEGLASYSTLEGWWTDAGTFPSYHKANNLMYHLQNR